MSEHERERIALAAPVPPAVALDVGLGLMCDPRRLLRGHPLDAQTVPLPTRSQRLR
jgi:hypothetical protein